MIKRSLIFIALIPLMVIYWFFLGNAIIFEFFARKFDFAGNEISLILEGKK